jgi:hypothetical protein
MILYLKDPKNSFKNKNLLDLTSTFINIAGYKINKQKSVAFLHTKMMMLIIIIIYRTWMCMADCLKGRWVGGWSGKERLLRGENVGYIYSYGDSIIKPTIVWKGREEGGWMIKEWRRWACSRYTVHMYGIATMKHPCFILNNSTHFK